MSNYEYEALDLSDLGKEVERLNKKPGDSDNLDNFVIMPDGDGSIVIRILPRLKNKQLWCATRTHKLFVGGLDRNFHCPRQLRDTPGGQYWIATEEHGDCPICQYYSKRWKASLEMGKDSAEQNKLQDYLRKIKPVERYYYNGIVRENFNKKKKQVERDVGPLIWSVGKMVHQKVCNGIFGNVKLRKQMFGDVSHPTTGRDFQQVKTMKGGFPDYAESEFLEPSPAGSPEQWEKWMAHRHDIFALRKLLSFEELERALMIHTGKIKDNKEGFDTSKYDPETPQFGGETRSETRPVTKQERKPDAAKAEQEVQTDPDFMAELDGISVDDE